ncbi:MAG: efflux RND transporter permease subunit, partial [Thiothrix sp.]
ATLIVVLVFVPLFFLAGIEGRLFAPLGVAYIVAIVASLCVAISVTPVLCYYLLGLRVSGMHADSPLVRLLKRLDTRLLHWSFRHIRLLLGSAVLLTVLAGVSVAWLPRAFLPA